MPAGIGVALITTMRVPPASPRAIDHLTLDRVTGGQQMLLESRALGRQLANRFQALTTASPGFAGLRGLTHGERGHVADQLGRALLPHLEKLWVERGMYIPRIR